jgi:hypothetical protein
MIKLLKNYSFFQHPKITHFFNIQYLLSNPILPDRSTPCRIHIRNCVLLVQNEKNIDSYLNFQDKTSISSNYKNLIFDITFHLLSDHNLVFRNVNFISKIKIFAEIVPFGIRRWRFFFFLWMVEKVPLQKEVWGWDHGGDILSSVPRRLRL